MLPAPREPYPSPALCPSQGLPEQSPSAFLMDPHAASRVVCEGNCASHWYPGKSLVLSLQCHLHRAALARGLPLHSKAGGWTAQLQLLPSQGCILPQGPGGKGRSVPPGPLTAHTSQGDAVPVSPGLAHCGGTHQLSSQTSPAAGRTLEPLRCPWGCWGDAAIALCLPPMGQGHRR